MQSLKICLLEKYPDFLDKKEIASRIEGLRIPIFHVIYNNKKSLSHIFNDVAKIFEKLLSTYGEVKFRIVVGHDEYFVAGKFNENTQQLTVILHHADLFFASQYENLWSKYSENIATTIAHELVHSWQYTKRKKYSAYSKIYSEDPEEIIAWAHDIVNEVSKEAIHSWFSKFLGNRFVKFDTILGLYSPSYNQFVKMLNDDVKNEHKKEKILKRLFKAVINFSGLT